MITVTHVIHTEAENEEATQLLEQLTAKERPTQEDRDQIELLSLLIKTFEDQNYQLKPAEPIEVLRELMNAHGLKQKDLVSIFKAPSIASEILNEKRPLTVDHIAKLANRFHVSPAVFIKAASNPKPEANKKRRIFGMTFTRTMALAKRAKRK
jgi:HTH-type transcriptional regulator/antitoxin HigA